MRKLADPRKLNNAEKERILNTMPAVVLLNCSIHSTEIGASQFSMELAYRMAWGQDEETLEILNNVVILLIPSPNPDGIDLVVDWYRKSVGKPHEGLAPPKLYQKYAGHDNNRDWYMLNLPETRAVTRVLYQQWFPQIVYDLHQMGRTSARMVIPPFYEVTNPGDRSTDPAANHAHWRAHGHGAVGGRGQRRGHRGDLRHVVARRLSHGAVFSQHGGLAHRSRQRLDRHSGYGPQRKFTGGTTWPGRCEKVPNQSA
ncbi:MAG: M14 family zinc carboxypeptidase [candidate division KSB1 bacterium]|nr:M14 family zinc carboxypeptidase [candidate division KSB1 bacterium]